MKRTLTLTLCLLPMLGTLRAANSGGREEIAMMTRRDFLKYSATAAAVWLGPKLEAVETVRLKSWQIIELPKLTAKHRPLMKITATNGAVGYSKPVAKDLSAAVKAVNGANLLEHEPLHDLMMAQGVPRQQVATLDIAAWDLHARMLNKPLHALLGTKKSKILRYGDVRGQQPNFSPQKYADSVARFFERSGMNATKLHFPGNMGTPQSISFPMILETLQAVRKAVGKDKTLAWDPYPGSAESATTSVDEAKQILKLMDELSYAWIEGPLPPTPYETQIPKYAKLVKTGTKQRIQAEGPGSPIGDGTPFTDMKRWAEAGAITQCSTDAYITTGATNCLRMLEYAKAHPPLVINLHWAWAPHAHLAMAYDEKVFPIAEFPMGEDVPKEYMSGPWLLAPDWPGIYRIG
jgi:L-alanine-DL-glutamate epimerase-like enolase superfamily enzyme